MIEASHYEPFNNTLRYWLQVVGYSIYSRIHCFIHEYSSTFEEQTATLNA